MHEDLKQIQKRILDVAIGALTQANHHAVFYDQHSSGWAENAILSAANAGELFLKAIVAKEHPLLIFKDLYQLDDAGQIELKIEHIIERGKTYGLEHMPKLLWVTTGERMPDISSFEKLRKARNSIQHFCSPDAEGDLQDLARQFIYKNIDPLINKHFNICAIEFHEDHSIGYDYVVECLVRDELIFSIPHNFSITEVDLGEAMRNTSKKYQKKLTQLFRDNGISLSLLGIS